MTDINNKPKLIHPVEIYLDHLTTITRVSLTQREIDVVSCLVNGRNTKGIANFLSIAPKTVAAHIYNATKKFGCDSDGMVALLANSEQFRYLKEYYAALLTDNLFKKSLKDIATLINDNNVPLNCVLVYWQGKPPFLANLEDNLTTAGITVSLESRKDIQSFDQLVQELYQDAYQISFLPDSLMEKHQTKALSLEISQLFNTKIFFFPKTKKPREIPKEICHFTCIDPSNWHSYYFSVFTILKKILPSFDLDPIFIRFENKAAALHSLSDYTPSPPLENLDKSNEIIEECFPPPSNSFMINKLGYALAGTLSVVLLLCLVLDWNDTRTGYEKIDNQGHHKNHVLDQKDLPNHSIRSDLIIPANSTLLNRPRLIIKVRDRFQKQLQEDIQTLALIGIGGAGKTTLARQYARSQNIPVVWEINADTKENLATSFETLAYALCQTDEEKKTIIYLKNIKNSSEKEEQIIQLVRSQLKARSNWLLIYDNVEKFSDIQKYFPSDTNLWGKGKVIITTQDNYIRNNSYVKENIQIGELDSDEKLSLFMQIMNHGGKGKYDLEQQESAKKLLERIPPFPLDISVAAYYIKATNIDYDTYVKYLIAYDQRFASAQENILEESSDYKKSRFHIVTLSLKKLIAVNKGFGDLLFLISALDSKNIPRDLLDRYKGKLIVDNFVYNLKKYSLITNSLDESNAPLSHIYIHDSTQNISFPYLTELLKLNKDSQILKEIVCVLDDYLDHAIEQEDFEKMKALLEHLEKFLNHPDLLTQFSKGLLKSKLGSMYYFFNKEKSLPTIQESFKILMTESSKVLSSEDKFRTARSLLQIGAIYTELRHYKEAQESLEKAAKIYGKSGLNNNNELSYALSNLGNLYRRLGNYEKARECLEESVRLNIQYGANVRRTVRTLSCLGSVYRGLGSYQKSIEILEESLILCKKYYPEDHFRIGRILRSLGNVYRRLGDYKQATLYLEQSLLIFKKCFPENHINIGLALGYLGNSLRERGVYEKSRECLEQSLKIHREHYDDEHARIGWILFHLANTYKALGMHQESQALFDKVLKIYERDCQETNIETARLLRDIAGIYLEKNRLDDAENYIIKSLNIFKNHSHVDVYKSLEVSGEIYFKKSIQLDRAKDNHKSQDFKSQAVDQFKQALKIAGQHFPKNSAHIERIQSRLQDIQEERL